MGVIILLAISLSLDTLGIGMAYAMSGIRIPWSTKMVIAALNALLTAAAVFAGGKLGERLPVTWCSALGGGVLLFLGIRMLRSALGEDRTSHYDRDDSHVLEPWEGIALDSHWRSTQRAPESASQGSHGWCGRSPSSRRSQA